MNALTMTDPTARVPFDWAQGESRTPQVEAAGTVVPGIPDVSSLDPDYVYGCVDWFQYGESDSTQTSTTAGNLCPRAAKLS